MGILKIGGRTSAVIALSCIAFATGNTSVQDWGGGAVLSLDRPYSLRNAESNLLEAEYHRLIAGDRGRSYIFPRPCFSGIDSSAVCEESGRWRHSDPTGRRRLSLSPLAGYEYRHQEEDVSAFDAGVLAWGRNGPISFDLDARIFSELHEDFLHPSFDREYVERQDESASGSIAYSSFSRYRFHLACDWEWGRLMAARDAAHWGPGLFQNLSFNQEAVPFNQLSFSTRLGPVSVISLYGQLASDNDWETDTTIGTRSLYAHRYEWRVSRNVLLGASEQLVLHRATAPFAFLPIVPLFMAKSGEKEALNNGNLAFDLSWRLPGIGHLYSEFFLDDLQSPTSLFDDHWGNKWAWMAGCHWIRNWEKAVAGLIAEYSRIEPWVYTHYRKNTSQTANFDHPLGNQAGPNSQTLTGKIYARFGNSLYLSGRTDLRWKGADKGSSLDDENLNSEPLRKVFLAGAVRPAFLFTPLVTYRWGGISTGLQGTLGTRTEAILRVQYQY